MRKGSRWQMLFLPSHYTFVASLSFPEEGICSLNLLFSLLRFLLYIHDGFRVTGTKPCGLWTLNESDRLEMTRRAGVGG